MFDALGHDPMVIGQYHAAISTLRRRIRNLHVVVSCVINRPLIEVLCGPTVAAAAYNASTMLAAA